MQRSLLADADQLLQAISTRQFLQPHQPLSEALQAISDELAVCPQAIDTAITWLGVDSTTAIGRLRRTELMQLTRSIHRFWQNAQVHQTQA